ncbi:FAD-binding domain-containing protein [Ascobolus immersus RN42]|uniref:FAD-binding domain-containing protein n=1 Tax=Ascobolus immersus RN42 TaxID=1160509 RepID=A0A3N4I348_ASCIM|nr:FAD-binding domain-containing protein [Ascobolus immersus RN42]
MKLHQLIYILPLLTACASAAPAELPVIDIDLPEADLDNTKILDSVLSQSAKDPTFKSNFPGLLDALNRVKKEDIGADDLARAYLKAVSGRGAFKKAFAELDDVQREQVQEFLDGQSPQAVVTKRGFSIPPSPAAKHHFKRMVEGPSLFSRRWLNAKRETTPVIYEDKAKTKPMQAFVATEFENWGLTIRNTPAITFVPTTVHGVENLIKWAKANNKRVRAAGYRHTWTDMYSADGEIFVSMLDLKTATAVPDASSILPSKQHPDNEFKVIELAEEDVSGSGGKKRLARIGAAVTNEEFRRWSVAGDHWTLPLNVVMVEITLGGSNVPICHGGGFRHKTLSDLVRKIEYVDANGKAQSVSDPKLLKAAAGSMGLLGIVTHVTFELDKMTYAIMKPEKIDTYLAIPPPRGYVVPLSLYKLVTPSKLQAAREKFYNDARNAYYSEWFWFPYQKRCLVNVWDNTPTKSSKVKTYPSPPDVFSQWIQGWLGGVINDDPLFRALPGLWQATFLGTLAMLALPPQLPGIGDEIHTYLIDALHFRRGVQNMRVRDIELQIPIPLDKAGDPMWEIVQRAWWDAISLTYADKRAPMRIAVEMRIMSGSDIVLAPQRGNWGTASIEVLTTMPAADEGIWDQYAQKVVDKWTSYKDANGKLLNVRPHWAKEWDTYTIHGQNWRQYAKNVSFKDAIPEFKRLLAEIGEEQGWTLEDLQKRFSVGLLDEVIFD